MNRLIATIFALMRFTPQTLRNIVNIMASKENILYKALQINPNRLGYCKKVNEELIRAINRKRPGTIRTETDNEKYAFRCWMLRLGLIGAEFKTCRLHFLKHLEGNSAWWNRA